MKTVENLTGRVFKRLTVLHRVENRNGEVRWECQCSCGNTHVVRTSSLKNGDTKSCGCLNSESARARRTTHGKTNSPEYQSWRGMKERCDNSKNSHYELYGMRGISYSKDWATFENFFNDMGNRPSDTQLDRIDVNLNYCKENCKWSSLSEQAFNIRLKSNNKSGRSGVYITKSSKFVVYIGYRKQRIRIGLFTSFEEACKAREKAEIELYGFSKE